MRRNLEYFAIGVMFGAMIGLVGGILVAPRSGYKTRQRLANEAFRAAELARGIADRAEQAAELIGGRFEHYLGRDEEMAWRKVREIREGVQRYTQAQT